MSIDEFGQFRRKKPAPRNNNQRNNSQRNTNQPIPEEPLEPITFRLLLTSVVAFFKRRGLSARIDQILTCILWLVYIFFLRWLYISDGLFIAIVIGFVFFFLGLCCQLIISAFISPWIEDQVRNRRYEYLVLWGLFVLAITFFGTVTYMENSSYTDAYSGYNHEYEREKYTDKHKEEYIGNEVYYCNKVMISVRSSLDAYLYIDPSMKRGEECTVLSSIGDYYKIAREGHPIGYVEKEDLTLKYSILEDSLLQINLDEVVVTAGGSRGTRVTIPTLDRRLLESAQQHFRDFYKLSADEFTDGQVLHSMGRYTYWGHVNSSGERHGKGTYLWNIDSMYVGNWANGVMSGYGMMYYYKQGTEKNGIWEYNNLEKPYSPLKKDVKFHRVDSTQRVRMSMMVAKIKG